MDKKLLFNDALSSLIEFAAANANHVSTEDIHTFFNDIIEDEKQYEFIYKYLQESKIKIDGMDYIVSEEVTINPKEEETKELEAVKAAESKVVETEAELAFIEMYKKDLEAIDEISEAELANLLDLLANGDLSVTNKIVESQLSKVADIANEFRGQGVTYGDLIQEANIGLMIALSEFNGSSDEFAAYVDDAIRNTLNLVINDQINEDRVGEHLANRMNELDEISRDLTELLGRAPTFEELAKKMGITEDEVETIVKTSLNVLNAGDSQDAEAINKASSELNATEANNSDLNELGLNDFESSILNNSVANDFGTSSPLINNTDEEFVSSETDLGDPLEWKINKK